MLQVFWSGLSPFFSLCLLWHSWSIYFRQPTHRLKITRYRWRRSDKGCRKWLTQLQRIEFFTHAKWFAESQVFTCFKSSNGGGGFAEWQVANSLDVQTWIFMRLNCLNKLNNWELLMLLKINVGVTADVSSSITWKSSANGSTSPSPFHLTFLKTPPSAPGLNSVFLTFHRKSDL